MPEGILFETKQSFSTATSVCHQLTSIPVKNLTQSLVKERVELLNEQVAKVRLRSTIAGIKLAAVVNRRNENEKADEVLFSGGYKENPLVQTLLMIDQIGLFEEKLTSNKIPVNLRNISVNLRLAFQTMMRRIHEKTLITLNTLEKYIQEYVGNHECFNYPTRLLNKVEDYLANLQENLSSFEDHDLLDRI